jgi:mercuric ion transport protein
MTLPKLTGALAVAACAVCCLVPLIGAGLLTGVAAAVLQQGLFAVAAGLAATAVGLWWLDGRRRARRAAAAPAGAGCAVAARTGCGASGCGGSC